MKGRYIMKKTYVKPAIVGEKFIANEYVAACYKIKCTTPNNNESYSALYNDDGDGIFDSQKDTLVYKSSFHGCGNWHKGVIRDSAPTANGFVTREIRVGGTFWDPQYETEVEKVFWWQESFKDGSIDYHVMTPGNENYETNPNAS